LLVKLATNYEEPWQFTVNRSDLEVIRGDMDSGDRFFLCLVCGLNTICILNSPQLKEILDLASAKQQWIKVKNTGSLRVWGKLTTLRATIPHNAFPNVIFEE